MIHLASCDRCPWEITCPSLARKEAAEAAHADRWHAAPEPVTDEVCEQLALSHPNELRVVVETIEACARVNHGQVDPNVVRELLPDGITPQVIGAAYNQLRRRGRLEPVEQGVSNDSRGRNVGKPTTIYRLVERVGSSW